MGKACFSKRMSNRELKFIEMLIGSDPSPIGDPPLATAHLFREIWLLGEAKNKTWGQGVTQRQSFEQCHMEYARYYGQDEF